ncbi:MULTISPECIES: CapA family protein [unclassified Mesorhizobium]|uniref:CapA family protein n=1 Tax=unclassified Mesorhizobium TaxID=325217 RepID=UPI000FCA9BFD|nr:MULTISPECIES: CapA family protein [unclassified Mesorhizobium]RVD30157.1 CapA family protein [Mesorhizobium sp. M4B.F.Ca.ET.017.02.2.1]RWA58951.1 MAG: CapA family protein [Mesorhizobium sp.]TGV24524.1 CapA family protein [Mesorhizobium sp. M4B.F.Ca.ET.143.01.1.1]TIX19451.1 MAG: CapA family protein [Mesorhizobium sp.]
MKDPFCAVVTGQSLITHDIRHVQDEQFAAVVRFLQQGDVVFTNFESTILGKHGGWPTKGRYFGYSRAEVLDALQDIGFNALALANNHAFDLGASGVLATLEEVEARGFLHAGVGIDETHAAKLGHRHLGARQVSLLAIDAGPGPANMYAENGTASRPARPGVNRLKTVRKIGVPDGHFRRLARLGDQLQSSHLELTNYAQPEDPPELTRGKELNFYGTVFTQAADFSRLIEIDQQSANIHFSAIRQAAAQRDFVIAYLHHHHWEPGWQDVPRWVQTFARTCIEAGAGLFVSHGAPVLQAVEIYNGSPIFYGLGNFLFHVHPDEGEWDPPEVWQSIVAACRYDANGTLEGIDLLPVVIGEVNERTGAETGKLVPVPAAGHVARNILEGFASRSRAFGTGIEISGCSGRIVPPLVRKFG